MSAEEGPAHKRVKIPTLLGLTPAWWVDLICRPRFDPEHLEDLVHLRRTCWFFAAALEPLIAEREQVVFGLTPRTWWNRLMPKHLDEFCARTFLAEHPDILFMSYEESIGSPLLYRRYCAVFSTPARLWSQFSRMVTLEDLRRFSRFTYGHAKTYLVFSWTHGRVHKYFRIPTCMSDPFFALMTAARN